MPSQSFFVYGSGVQSLRLRQNQEISHSAFVPLFIWERSNYVNSFAPCASRSTPKAIPGARFSPPPPPRTAARASLLMDFECTRLYTIVRNVIHVKIQPMKTSLRRFENPPSYRPHRKQVLTQILLPLLFAVLLFAAVLVLTSLAPFRGGDVSRWAAISTLLLVIPVIVAGLALLVLLMVMIYLLARITKLIPPYSYQAQRFVHRVEGGIQRAAGMIRKPVLALQGLAGLVKARLGRA